MFAGPYCVAIVLVPGFGVHVALAVYPVGQMHCSIVSSSFSSSGVSGAGAGHSGHVGQLFGAGSGFVGGEGQTGHVGQLFGPGVGPGAGPGPGAGAGGVGLQTAVSNALHFLLGPKTGPSG